MGASSVTLFKPAPPHNHLKAPATCMCIDCCHIVTQLRCPATDPDGHQCGNYRDHRGEHSLLVSTAFQIAAERIATAEAQT